MSVTQHLITFQYSLLNTGVYINIIPPSSRGRRVSVVNQSLWNFVSVQINGFCIDGENSSDLEPFRCPEG